MSYNKHGLSGNKSPGDLSNASRITPEAVRMYYEALDCPRSLACYMLFKYQEHDQLAAMECNPFHYENGGSFRDAYLATLFLQKSVFLDLSTDKRQLALDKFLKFEEVCRETNARLSKTRDRDEFHGHGALLNAMRCKIDDILGEFNPLELFERSSFGPGVSTRIKGEETFAAKKFQYETGITRDLYPLVRDLFPLAYPGWWEVLLKNGSFPHFEVGNAVVTVPKTSKIDRVIAIEPGINLWLQLGLGRMIRRRMGKVGIDLTDQRVNQRLSYKASKTGLKATVDFSSASDSIASGLVSTLFSSFHSLRWFEVMDLIRSKYGTIDGKVFEWSKFSSMGNGFTFDLETLIFYCAAAVCCEAHGIPASEVSVYGDDVILPTVVYRSFSSFVGFLGFTVSPQKSFSSGWFRESCGAHYWRGLDCKPVFLQQELATVQQIQNFANLVRIRSMLPYGCDKRFSTLFYYLLRSVPTKYRFRVPLIVDTHTGEKGALEGGFLSNFDECCPRRLPFENEGFVVRHLGWIPLKREVDYPGLLLARLFSIPAINPEGNENPLRGRVRRISLETPVRQWYDLGPWI